MNKEVLFASLILDILASHAFPLAVKIINTLTAGDDVTLEKILDLKKKVPDIAELEAELGIVWEEK